MTLTRIELSPVTRISGLLSVEAELENHVVTNARVSGTLYRGFEIMLPGRKVEDAPYFTQRICGICSLAHGLVAARAVEQACQINIPPSVELLRNVLLGFELLQNHIRHFYLLVLPDYVESQALPFQSTGGRDYRFSLAETHRLVSHYYEAIDVSLLCHQCIALFGGKAPHQHGIVPGGVTVSPHSDLILKALANLDIINNFLNQSLARDVDLLSRRYEDYFTLGAGPSNYLSFGLFTDPATGSALVPGGAVYKGVKHPLNLSLISLDVDHSWFIKDDPSEQYRPAPDQPEGYSWVKAPRYNGKVMEVGPLARMIVAGLTPPRSSTMDRIVARARETVWTGSMLTEWLPRLEPAMPKPQKCEKIKRSSVNGATEVLRGPLLHQLESSGDTIAKYEIITPSEWNFSPRDSRKQPGAAELSLTGLKVKNMDSPVEIYRTLRSFDPCISCATHLIKIENGERFIVC